MKKKVFIIATPLDRQFAGIYTYLYELSDALDINDSRSFDYTLIRERKSDEWSNINEVIIPNYNWIPGFGVIRYFILIPLICILKGADLVFEPAHFGPFNLTSSIKRVVFIHDLTPVKFPEFHKFITSLLQRIFLPSVMRKADLILTNSEYTKSDISQYMPITKEKTVSLHLSAPSWLKPSSNLLSGKISERINNSYFLFVGTIEPRKNLELLMKAYEMMRSSDKRPVDLVIVGKKGWKSAKFFETYEKHPYKASIHLLGYVPKEQLPVLYSNCVGFVYPSIYEGFGLPIVEAMKCGAPVIAADNTSLKEITDGYGLLFNTHDPEDLADKMKEMSTNHDLRSDLSKKSLERSSQFSWEKHVEEFEEALEGLF